MTKYYYFNDPDGFRYIYRRVSPGSRTWWIVSGKDCPGAIEVYEQRRAGEGCNNLVLPLAGRDIALEFCYSLSDPNPVVLETMHNHFNSI